MKIDELQSWVKSNFKKFFQKLNDVHLIGSLTFIGLLLRLQGMRLGLWRDEAYTYFDAIPVNLEEVFKRIIYTEGNPPFFFLIMHQWLQWLGGGDFTFKVPALIFGVLLIPATYFLGLVVSSRRIGVIAAVITTFASEAIYYSQEARPYTLGGLFCCLTVILYCQALSRKSNKGYLVGFVLCGALLIYTHYTGLLVVGSLAIITLYLWWRGRDHLRIMHWAIAFGMIFVLFTPWLPAFWVHLHTGTPFLSVEIWWNRYRVFFRNLVYTIPLPMEGQLIRFPDLLLRKAIAWLVLLVLAIEALQVFSQSRKSMRQWSESPRGSITIVLMCFVLFNLMLSALSRSGRYVFLITPLAWVLYSSWLSFLFDYIRSNWTRQQSQLARWVALISLIVLFILPSTSYALNLRNGHKSGLRPLAADLQKKLPEKTFYLISPDYFASTFAYYFAQHPVQFYGFAHWERPEIWTAQGYVELWDDPTLVSRTEERIRDEAQKGYRQLALVYRNASNAGQIKYSQVQTLLSRLKQTYPLLEQKEYYGKQESVTLYLFSLDQAS